MTSPTFGLVLTTIYSADVLQGYCTAAEREGLKDQLRIFVIPDRKTPAAIFESCRLIAKHGFRIVCPTVEEQDEYLSRLGTIRRLIPYNSDNRRNIGFLMCLEQGCEVLISIDDDNFCLDQEGIFSAYGKVLDDAVTLPAVNSSNGWFNLCEMLTLEPSSIVYPRGFPYNRRHQKPTITESLQTSAVRLNAGLWLSEPDLDAMTWLVAPVRATGWSGKSVLLGEKTWSPINTQNTSLHRDLIAAYYFVRMGYPLAGMPIDRYGDIFSGYLVQACVRHLGHGTRVGTPIADHRRNTHNYLRDMMAEAACIAVLEDFTDWLSQAELQGSSYSETYRALAEAIDDQVEQFSGSIWNDETRGYFHQMTYCMRQWVRTCEHVGGGAR